MLNNQGKNRETRVKLSQVVKTKRDVNASNSFLRVNIAGKQNALSRRREEDRVTCIRRRRAATQSDNNPEKRANDTNELPATLSNSTLFHHTFFSQ